MVSQRITTISVTPIPAYFPHEIGRNAYNWGHGTTTLEWLVRARTDGGIEGLTIGQRFMGMTGGWLGRATAQLAQRGLSGPSDRRIPGGVQWSCG